MIEELHIHGLGVIDDAVLEFGPGFTVLTGETGAGKTMVLTGLALLLGGRADSALVRADADRALIEGRVRVDTSGPLVDRARDAGAELDDDTLLVSRTVTAEGRSRAHLGGRAVPATILAELADDLVAVHGQHEQQRLLRPSRQREALDRCAGDAVAKPLQRWTAAYDRLQRIAADLAQITGRTRERAREADLLRFGIDEVGAVDPRPAEDTELDAEIDRLSHADALRSAAELAHAALLGDPVAETAADAVALVGSARNEIDRVRGHDPVLAELADRLAEVGYLLADVAADLASYAAGLETDPRRLALAQDRRAALSALLRKYGDTVDDVLAWANRAQVRLSELDTDDDRLVELRAERAACITELSDLAVKLTAARSAAAQRLSAAVGAELAALAMPHARLVVDVRQTDRDDGLPVGDRRLNYGRTGVDSVELLLAAHRGAEPRPLQKGASGGELSRVMLAIEVVLAGVDPVPAFVFDEVDAGVGGRAAVELGRRLARLAETAQVIVVTHLPQVAAFADRHLVVAKADDGSVTRAGVTSLDDRGRVGELARMLAGLEGSELAQAHAEELLALASGRDAAATAVHQP